MATKSKVSAWEREGRMPTVRENAEEMAEILAGAIGRGEAWALRKVASMHRKAR